MARDHQHNPDPNQNAARIVAESTSGSTATPGDLEAAWSEWSRHIQKIDNHVHALALHYFHYNFIRKHQTLTPPPPWLPVWPMPR